MILGVLSFWPSSYAQKDKPVITNYSFKFKVDGLKDTDVFLGFHYGEKKFIKDTAHVNAKGEVEFAGTDTLIGGIYLFITPKRNYFEFVVNETKIQMETDTVDMIGHMSVKKSAENTVWYSYMKFIVEMQKEMAPFSATMKTADKESKEYKDAEKELDKIGDKILFLLYFSVTKNNWKFRPAKQLNVSHFYPKSLT